jgi:hypothetical protein
MNNLTGPLIVTRPIAAGIVCYAMCIVEAVYSKGSDMRKNLFAVVGLLAVVTVALFVAAASGQRYRRKAVFRSCR